MFGNYFASFDEMIDIIKSNIELENTLKELQECNYKSNDYSKFKDQGIYDPYFGCDPEYMKLLTKNTELKYKINKFYQK